MRLAAVKPTTNTQTALSFYALGIIIFRLICSESEITKEIHGHVLFLTDDFFTRWNNIYVNTNKDAIICSIHPENSA